MILNIDFALKFKLKQIHRENVLYVSNESNKISPQYFIFSSTPIRWRPLPLKSHGVFSLL